MLGIWEVLKEQCDFGFTGRVNILSRESNQYLGSVSLHEGFVVAFKYNNGTTIEDLLDFVVLDLKEGSFKFIPEPEIIDDNELMFRVDIYSLKLKIETRLRESEKPKLKRPPNNIKLLINKDVVVDNNEITENEFSVLKTIADYNNVEEIYNNLKMSEDLVTETLTSLRKKNALKVIKINK